MSLTPLHFPRGIEHDGTSCAAHGHRRYKTDCGRFCLIADNGSWYVTATWSHADCELWIGWLVQIGLSDEPMKTRNDALKTLNAALEFDGLMNDERP